MTQTGYSNAIVNLMLGWLKGLASWVLKLFNLAGGASPLEWFSQHWLKLLILLMAVGIIGDFVVWMVRWRPYWIWFKRKRVIVNDERLLAGEAHIHDEAMENSIDREYIVHSEVVGRRKSVPKAEVRRASSGRRRTRLSEGGSLAFSRDLSADDLFEVGRNQQEFSDYSEDEVFNVSSLASERRQRSRRKRRRA